MIIISPLFLGKADIYDSSDDSYDNSGDDFDQTILPQATHPTAAQMLALYFFWFSFFEAECSKYLVKS